MLPLIFELLDVLVSLALIVLIANAVLSWLIAFDIVDRRNQLISTLWTFTQRLSDPLLAPIRRIVPPIGGIDLAPLILALVLIFGLRIIRVLILGY